MCVPLKEYEQFNNNIEVSRVLSIKSEMLRMKEMIDTRTGRITSAAAKYFFPRSD